MKGRSWHTRYCADARVGGGAVRWVGRAGVAGLSRLQRRMADILQGAGFTVLPPYPELKALAAEYTNSACAVGGGWLLAAETAAWVRAGYARVLGVLPFGCLPGHIYGRGQYAALQRKLPGSRIVGVDYDAGLRDGTVESRIRMLLDMEP